MSSQSTKPKAKNNDVIIIGAGAAGLACAEHLSSNAINCLVLEARDRIGGRVHTDRNCKTALPQEFGAEFIHGAHSSILDFIHDGAIPFLDIPDHHLFRNGNTLEQRPEYFDLIAEIMKKLRNRDQSIDQFIQNSRLSKSKRDLFKAFVEGFHSADTLKLSETGLKSTEESVESDLNGVENFRLPRGYDEVIQTLSKSLVRDCSRIELNQEVVDISWKPQDVHVTCRHTQTGHTTRYRGSALVVTLPLGVLKANTIKWSPAFPFQKHVEALEMGHALRLVCQFRTRFWESLSDESVTYLHASPAHRFPTWWTQAPARTSTLIAWQGGPKAEEMASWSTREITDTAVETLAYIAGMKPKEIKKELVSVRFHNWSSDPYTRGAYSYIPVGGFEKAKQLRRPYAQTIFIAGEATAEGPTRATVHGAIETGVRSAKQILKRGRKP